MLVENFKPGEKYMVIVPDYNQSPSLICGEIVEVSDLSTLSPDTFVDTKGRYIRKADVFPLNDFLFSKKFNARFYSKRWTEKYGSLIRYNKELKNKKKGAMSFLTDIPKNIKKLLNKPTRAMYQLGWIDQDLAPTEKGETRLTELCFEKFKEELGVMAIKELAEIKKRESENE